MIDPYLLLRSRNQIDDLGRKCGLLEHISLEYIPNKYGFGHHLSRLNNMTCCWVVFLLIKRKIIFLKVCIYLGITTGSLWTFHAKLLPIQFIQNTFPEFMPMSIHSWKMPFLLWLEDKVPKDDVSFFPARTKNRTDNEFEKKYAHAKLYDALQTHNSCIILNIRQLNEFRAIFSHLWSLVLSISESLTRWALKMRIT